jgi:hypothetical protein
MANRNQVAVGLRIPKEIAEWLKREAAESQRSVSNQAAWIIGQHRKQQEATNAKTPS